MSQADNNRGIDEKSKEPKILKQEELLEMVIPLVQQLSVVHRKKKNVFARPAEAGENITTVTSDGVETVNTAQRGDYIVMNQTDASELYILTEEKFKKNYTYIKPWKDGFDEYRSKGKIKALELHAENLQLLNRGRKFYFEAPWGEVSVAKEGDFLAVPLDHSEVYRIGRREFLETYEQKTQE